MLVSSQVSQLQQQGRLTGAALAQMFTSVSNRLNDALPDKQDKSVKKEVRICLLMLYSNSLYPKITKRLFWQKLRQQMLQSMSDAISMEPPKNPAEVQMSADAVVGLTTQGDELTGAAQVSLNKSILQGCIVSSNSSLLAIVTG